MCTAGKLLRLRIACAPSETEGMTENDHKKLPGDLIIDRYMPNATDTEREEARANLRAYLVIVLRIAARVEDEEKSQGPIRVNPESAVDSGHPPTI